MTRPEILAPGGSPESIYSAVNAGCDAIYAGGKRFGARAFADNQDNDKLIEILGNIHLAGKKLYLTVNTVLTEHETGCLYDYLCPLYDNGLDAVIVQDMGVLKFIHEHFPGLQIHASTQMSITGAEAANLLMGYGVTRVVPARELTLRELGSMRKRTGAELEVFVHGALCSSYSGQCLMSSLIGGRSGNRGACAQPCRKQYCLNGSAPGYYLSLRDLCTLEIIPDLVKCGIDSFKIEGRMKKPEYTALAVHMYRKYVDIYFETGDEAYADMVRSSPEFADDMKALKDIYNRGGFTRSYLVNNIDNAGMLSGNRPNHEGIITGVVKDIKNGRVHLQYNEDISAGDILEIRNAHGEKVHDFTSGQAYNAGNRQSINPGYNYKSIKNGMKVYRVRNQKLIDNILTKYPPVMKPLPVEGKFTARVGHAAELSVWLAGSGVSHTVYGDAASTADKHPADEAYIRSKVMVSGGSPFVWSLLSIDIDEGIYLPPSGLKDMRRRAFTEYTGIYQGMYGDRMKSYENAPVPSWDTVSGMDMKCTGRLIAECHNIAQLKEVLKSNIYDSVYVHIRGVSVPGVPEEQVMSDIDMPFYIVLPRIIRNDNRYAEYEQLIRRLRCKLDHFSGIVVCTLEQLAVYGSLCEELGIKLCTYDNMYVRNPSAAAWYMENGADAVMSSVEMTDREIADMSGHFGGTAGPSVLIYGKPAAMITAWTPGEKGELKDSYGNVYTVLPYDDYNEIINYEAVNCIDKADEYNVPLRVMFTDEDAFETAGINRAVMERFRR